ncbi:hypothetical protein [Aquabacterium sp.]|uniref:hypothetical protein n=1 Tax=Aquabacterium sp. TaxID=1872578 RepID=UPI0035C6DD27
MSVWLTQPVAKQRELVLVDWSIHELNEDGERSLVLVGYSPKNAEGRVSSEVVELDTATLRATTSSGRVYLLEGPPGRNSDAEYVFARYKRMYKLQDKTQDVTSHYYTRHLAHTRSTPTGAGVH